MGGNFAKPIITPVGDVQEVDDVKTDIQLLSATELQKQFDDIYRRSNSKLMTLVKNPCKELENRITECLQSNPLQLGKCIKEMDVYRSCVEEDVAELMLEKMALIKEN